MAGGVTDVLHAFLRASQLLPHGCAAVSWESQSRVGRRSGWKHSSRAGCAMEVWMSLRMKIFLTLRGGEAEWPSDRAGPAWKAALLLFIPNCVCFIAEQVALLLRNKAAKFYLY